jgi:peptidoglycan/xylan/chitin deacetylase (PgdA/CDA1 family)
MFHNFHSGKHMELPGSIDADALRQMLLTIAKTHDVVTPDEFLDGLRDSTLSSRQVVLTFDDALKSQIDVALPVLIDLGLKGLFNVYTGIWSDSVSKLEIYARYRAVAFGSFEDFFVDFCRKFGEAHAASAEAYLGNFPEDYLMDFPFYSESERKFRFLRDQVASPDSYEETMDSLMTETEHDATSIRRDIWMTESDLVALVRENHAVGLHSHTHPTNLAALSREEQMREYVTNYSILSEITGVEPQFVAHPCGSYSTETLELLTDLGVTCGFRSSPTAGGTSNLEIPREDHAVIHRRLQGGLG